MTSTDDPQHRAYHQPDPDAVTVREFDDGTFGVRMPIASTGEVRNEGDEPLTRDEIDGMARQINDGSVGVFLDHGRNVDVAGSRYSAVGKVGEWRDADVQTRDTTAADVVEAEARLMDPDTLPAATGSVREALAALKAQAERDIALSSSIGWRDDEDFAGGVDLMEASIVGIPADPRTSQDGPAAAMARAALENRDDVDAEALVDQFRAVVMGPDARSTMSEDTTESGDEPDDTNDESDGMDATEYRQSMLEMQRQQTQTLDTLSDAIRADGEDDEDEDEDDEDDDMNGQDADGSRLYVGETDGGDVPEMFHDVQDLADDDGYVAATDIERDGDVFVPAADAGERDERDSITVGDEELTAADVRDLREQLGDARDDDAVETAADRDAEDDTDTDADDDTASRTTTNSIFDRT